MKNREIVAWILEKYTAIKEQKIFWTLGHRGLNIYVSCGDWIFDRWSFQKVFSVLWVVVGRGVGYRETEKVPLANDHSLHQYLLPPNHLKLPFHSHVYSNKHEAQLRFMYLLCRFWIKTSHLTLSSNYIPTFLSTKGLLYRNSGFTTSFNLIL